MPIEDRKKELDAALNKESQEEEKNKNEDTEDKDKEESEDNAGAEEETRENEEEKEETDEEEKGKENQGKGEEESNDEEDDSESEEKSGKNAEEDKSKPKDKWHGKSREEVIRMYEELEKNPTAKTDKADSETGKDDKTLNEENETIVPSNEEFAKMTPKQFAEWMLDRVKNIVDKNYDTRSRMRDSVNQEIQDAQKSHPLLKTNPEYRELVLSLIDSASQKGIVMPLKEACAKVDGFAGKVKGDVKISDAEKIRLKKAKAQVERGAGAPASPGEDKSAEERRLEGIFGTGGPKSPLGGLGV